MVDLWPYSGRDGGRVSDREHEHLWADQPDGVLPGQGSEALQVYPYQQAGGVQVQPGRIRVAGHVLHIDDKTTVEIDPTSGQDRVDLITAHIDRTSDPWTYGVRAVKGSPGQGRPAINQNPDQHYDVILRVVVRSADGGLAMGADERPFLSTTGLRVVSQALSIPGSLDTYATRGPARAYRYDVAGITWVYVNGAVRRKDGQPWSANQRDGGVMATLPHGYRPKYNVSLPTTASTQPADIEINAGLGQLKMYCHVAGPYWVSLAGSFPILD